MHNFTSLAWLKNYFQWVYWKAKNIIEHNKKIRFQNYMKNYSLFVFSALLSSARFGVWRWGVCDMSYSLSWRQWPNSTAENTRESFSLARLLSCSPGVSQFSRWLGFDYFKNRVNKPGCHKNQHVTVHTLEQCIAMFVVGMWKSLNSLCWCVIQYSLLTFGFEILKIDHLLLFCLKT